MRTQVDNVSVLENTSVRNAVTDDFVDRAVQVSTHEGRKTENPIRAVRFRKVSVSQCGRVRIPLDGRVVYNFI